MVDDDDILDTEKTHIVPPSNLRASKESLPIEIDDLAPDIAFLSIADVSNDPSTPTTFTALEAATTGTESSYEHGIDEDMTSEDHPRQVIAVSVSKGPSAFYYLARKFLITDEECDLSALEGAIVSAVDAAHLLERSKIATIVRIQTSYVSVEPKKRRENGPSLTYAGKNSPRIPETETGATSAPPETIESSSFSLTAVASTLDSPSLATPTGRAKSSSAPLRRARMVITVRRTEAYKTWLIENPIHDINAVHDLIDIN